MSDKVSYREWMTGLVTKPIMSAQADEEFKKYLSIIKTERITHPDTFLRAVFEYAGKVTEELLGLDFIEPFGDGYVLKIKV